MLEPGLPRLILVDDHQMVLDAFKLLLERSFRVVGEATSGQALLALLSDREADCVVLDLEMPGLNGLELIPQLRRVRPAVRILVVTMLLDRVIADAAITAGADGFVPKDAGADELMMALEEVLQGRRYISPRVPKTSHRVGLGAGHRALHRLTPRQHQILLFMGEGKTETEIADLLHLGRSTITFHKHSVMRMLGVETDSGLVRYAVLVRAAMDSAG